MQKVAKQKRWIYVVIALIACVCIAALSIGLMFGSVSADVEPSIWDGDLVAAGWKDSSDKLWKIDITDVSGAEPGTTKTAPKEGEYIVDTGEKTIKLKSAAAFAYFAHEVSIDLSYRLDEYTVTLETDVDFNNHFWMPIGSTVRGVANPAYFGGTFKGAVPIDDNGNTRAAKIVNFTFDAKKVFTGATIVDTENYNDTLKLSVGNTTISMDNGPEGQKEYANLRYADMKGIMISAEEFNSSRYAAKLGYSVPTANVVGGVISDELVQDYLDLKIIEDSEHASEYRLLKKRYNKQFGDYKLIYKSPTKSDREYFRDNTGLLAFTKDAIDNNRIVDNASSTGNTSNLSVRVDAGQVYSYGLFAYTDGAKISDINIEFGGDWDISNTPVNIVKAKGDDPDEFEDTGEFETIIADQVGAFVGFARGSLEIDNCRVGTPANPGTFKSKAYSNVSYGAFVGRAYGTEAANDYTGNETFKITNSTNYASFDSENVGTESPRAAGFAGYIRYHGTVHMENCVNYGNMQSIVAGGIIGDYSNDKATDMNIPVHFTFEKCYNYGTIESVIKVEINSTNNEDINSTTYEDIHPKLTLKNTNSGVAGGMVGNLQARGYATGSTLIFKDCQNHGDVFSEAVAGGLVGQYVSKGSSSWKALTKQSVENCYNYGTVYADVALTKIPVKSEILNPEYVYTIGNTYAGAFFGRIGSGTINNGLDTKTTFTVTYETSEVGGKTVYASYGRPAASNQNAYAVGIDGNYITFEDGGETVYQRYTRNFLNEINILKLTGASTGTVISANPAAGAGADGLSGGGARIYTKGSFFVDGSDSASKVININLGDAFMLWVKDAANNGSSTRSATGTFNNNLYKYLGSIADLRNDKFHYISGLEGAADGASFDKNTFPTFEWVDDLDWEDKEEGESAYSAPLAMSAPARAGARIFVPDASKTQVTFTYTSGTSCAISGTGTGIDTTYTTVADAVAAINALDPDVYEINIVVAASVQTLTAACFPGWTQDVASLTFADGTKIKTIGESAGTPIFTNISIGTIVIPNSSQAITLQKYAFKDIDINLLQVDASANNITISNNAFEGKLENEERKSTIGKIIFADRSKTLTLSVKAFLNRNIGEIEYSCSASPSTNNFPFTGAAIGKVTFYPSTQKSTATGIPANALRDAASIGEIEIEEGITGIGDNAFYGTSATALLVMPDEMDKISLPSTLTDIGVAAFYYVHLPEFTIPASVKNIGKNAFSNANNVNKDGTVKDGNYVITEITLADNSELETIGDTAFSNAIIKKMDLPATLKSIGVSAFERKSGAPGNVGSTEAAITLSASNNVLTSIGDTAFNYARIADMRLPASLITVGNNVFVNAKKADGTPVELTMENKGEQIESIGTNAFKGVVLSDFKLGSGITALSEGVFNNAVIKNDSGVLEVTSLTSIGKNAFAGAKNKDGGKLIISFDDDGEYVETTGATPFNGVIVANFTFKADLTEIPASMFSGAQINNSNGQITIPADVTIIGASAFYNAKNSSGNKFKVKFANADKGASVTTLGASAFYNIEIEEIVLNNTLTSIGASTFNGAIICNAGGLILPESVTDLGSSAFRDAKNASGEQLYVQLTKKTQLTSIASDSLRNVSINAISLAMENIPSSAFYYATIGELTIAEGVNSISASSFANAQINNENVIVIPTTLTTLGASAFSLRTNVSGSQTRFKLAAGHPGFASLGTSSLRNLAIKEVTVNFDLPEGIFYGSTLDTLVINAGVLGKNALYGTHIKTLRISHDITAIHIDDTTGLSTSTSSTTQIYELVIDNNVENFVDGTFYAAKIMNVTINRSTIYGALFQGAEIMNLKVSAGAITLDGTLFNDLRVGKLILPDGLETISSGVFTSSNIGELVVPESVKSIGDFAFRGTKVSKLSFAGENNITSIGNFAFGGAAIDQYPISEGLVSIGDGAFAQVKTNETVLRLPSTLKHIGIRAFGGNTRLNNVYVPAGLASDVDFNNPFDEGTPQNPLYIIADDSETYFRLKEENEFFNACTSFTYVVTIEYLEQDAEPGAAPLLPQETALYGVSYSTAFIYEMWTNNVRTTLPEGFDRYFWYSNDSVVGNIGSFTDLLRAVSGDKLTLYGVEKVGKYAFVARTDIVYNAGFSYDASVTYFNLLLDQRFSLVEDGMSVKVVTYNDETAEDGMVVCDAGKYTVQILDEEGEALGTEFELNIARAAINVSLIGWKIEVTIDGATISGQLRNSSTLYLYDYVDSSIQNKYVTRKELTSSDVTRLGLTGDYTVEEGVYARYRNSEITVSMTGLPAGAELDYTGGTRSAIELGKYTLSATINSNFVFVNGTDEYAVDLVWYIVDEGNWLVMSDGNDYYIGGEYTSEQISQIEMPSLKYPSNLSDVSKFTLEVLQGNEYVHLKAQGGNDMGVDATLSTTVFGSYFNSVMPAGSYRLTVNIVPGTYTRELDDETTEIVGFAGFTESYTFTVTAKTIDPGDIATLYQSGFTFKKSEQTAPNGYDLTGGGVAEEIARLSRDMNGNTEGTAWNGTQYYSDSYQITFGLSNLAGATFHDKSTFVWGNSAQGVTGLNTMPAGRYTVYYKLSAKNYAETVNSFIVNLMDTVKAPVLDLGGLYYTGSRVVPEIEARSYYSVSWKSTDSYITGGEHEVYLVLNEPDYYSWDSVDLPSYAAVDNDRLIVTFTILAATNGWAQSPSLITWSYGGFDTNVNRIFAAPYFLDAGKSVMYTVIDKNNTVLVPAFTSDDTGKVTDADTIAKLNTLAVLPTGETYTLRVAFESTDNYIGLEQSIPFIVGKRNNTWATSLNVVSWIEGRFDPEIEDENGETIYPVQVAAAVGEVYIEILANDTDSEGNEIVLLEKTLYGSDELTDYLKGMDIGTYLIRASVAETENYNGLSETKLFRVFQPPEGNGLPWWATLLIALGSVALVVIVFLILWKKGVFRIITDKILISIRTRVAVDSTIAAVRAQKMKEQVAESRAQALAKEKAEEGREKAKVAAANYRALPAETKAQQAEDKAQAAIARAEKARMRAEAMQLKASRMRERLQQSDGSAPEQPKQSDSKE